MKKLSLFYLLSFILIFASCRNFKDLECTGVSGFTVNKINTEGIDANILLKIKNPNRVGFSIYKSEFDIAFSGIGLGKAKLVKRVHIKGNTEETYSFNLKNDFKDINVMDILKLLGSNAASRRGMVEVKGDLRAGKFYLKKKIRVDVKEKIGLN
ncbi:MAG: LEA type 2 family protein [Bacteroidetes bacterium]|nr:LEA type 2 family protein [Bacteroidota bacterium]